MSALAYSTTTGYSAFVSREVLASDLFYTEDDPHCFVCARHTDHFAEHDDLVATGEAKYGADGTVYYRPVNPWAFV